MAAVARARCKGLEMTRSAPSMARATASACRRPSSVSGRSARPTSKPVAFPAVCPWRTMINIAASPDQDAAAVLAVDDGLFGLAPDLVDLGGRQRQVTARALVADQAGRAHT